MKKTYKLTYKTYGDHAILMSWPDTISEDILQDIVSFKAAIHLGYDSGTIEINSAYNTMLVIYKTGNFNFKTEVSKLRALYRKNKNTKTSIERTLWKIPVCYEDRFAIDLEAMALDKQMTKAELIKRHTQPLYTVYFIGFLPGFLYLGGLDKVLHTPRKETPRLKIKTGAVAIGGGQTGVYPSESPGGWNIIGNSPICFFDVSKDVPCFAKPGDKIQFYEVPLKTYKTIKLLVEGGVYQIESEVLHD